MAANRAFFDETEYRREKQAQELVADSMGVAHCLIAGDFNAIF